MTEQERNQQIIDLIRTEQIILNKARDAKNRLRLELLAHKGVLCVEGLMYLEDET